MTQPGAVSSPGRAEKEGPDWMTGAAIYHVYVRSFQDTTGSGEGDLRGVIERLPHIVALGADAIWLSPFFVSPMADSGYDIADHCDVDPHYGTLNDFDALVSAAHGAGLKVIIDLVFSHTSDRHPWFRESSQDRENPKADWYVWADPKPDGTPPNNWLSVFGGPAWSWDRVREQYYLHDFLPSQPSLDFANPELRRALLDIASFWVARGVDCFRLDTMNSYFHDADLRDNPPRDDEEAGRRPAANPFHQQLHLYDRAQRGDIAPLQAFVSAIEILGAATIVGEIGNRLKRTEGPIPLRCHTYLLPDAPLEAEAMGETLAAAWNRSPDGRVCWALSNHDTPRHASRLRTAADGRATALQAAALLACLPGAVVVYQGEELGLEEADVPGDQVRDPLGLRLGPAIRGRDGCRTPMVWDDALPNCGFTTGEPWLSVAEAHRNRCAARQASERGSILSAYRELLALRKRLAPLRIGDFHPVDLAEGVLAFTRSDGIEMVLVALNLSDLDVSFDLGGSMSAGAALVHGEASVGEGRLTLAAGSYAVLAGSR